MLRAGLAVAACTLAILAPAAFGGVSAGPGAVAGRVFVEDVFVREVNHGDYADACRLYSKHYLKASQASCRSLYRWGEQLYGPYDYRVVRRRFTARGHRHIDLVIRHHHSFVEFAREPVGWRIVAGGF